MDIPQKVNKSLLLKENQSINFVRFQTSQLYLKTYYNKIHISLELWLRYELVRYVIVGPKLRTTIAV